MRTHAAALLLSTLLSGVVSALALGCSSASSNAGAGSTNGTGIPGGGDYAGPPSAPGTPSGGGDPSDDAGAATAPPDPGDLTAGSWDDDRNYDFYLAYTKAKETAAIPGLPVEPRADRLRVGVADGAGAALGGAHVVVTAGATTVFDGPTGTDGHVDVYPAWSGVASGAALSITASGAGGASSASTASAHAGDANVTLTLGGETASLPTALDVAIMIDTTGSMGDELAYLTKEIDAITTNVRESWPTASQRWAVVAYKDVDTGDPYVVQTTPFSSDMAAVQATISGLSASGGGDYPESPELAMQASTTLDWRGGNTARVLFWIADAPHHVGKEATLVSALAALRGEGVHVYPIAASGADDLLEYTMRTSAQITAGRYLFLTDDSGIGDPHKVPEIPCYQVTKLESAMERAIASEMSGKPIEPRATEVIRTVGDPKDGACVLQDGSRVTVY